MRSSHRVIEESIKEQIFTKWWPRLGKKQRPVEWPETSNGGKLEEAKGKGIPQPGRGSSVERNTRQELSGQGPPSGGQRGTERPTL